MLNIIASKIISVLEQIYYSINVTTMIYVGLFIIWIIFNRFHRLNYQTPLTIGLALLIVSMFISIFSVEAAGIVAVYVFLCIVLAVFQILTEKDKKSS